MKKAPPAKAETPAATATKAGAAKATKSAGSGTRKAAARKSAGPGPLNVKFPKGIFSHATGTNTGEPFPDAELEKFKELVQTERQDAQEQLEELSDQLREMAANEGEDNSAYSLHMEQGTDAMEREKTFMQAQRQSDYVKKLDEAAQRIQDGSFGLCRICGLRLDPMRLRAVPVTQVCAIYKNTSKPCEPGRIYIEAVRATLPPSETNGESEEQES